MSTKAVIAFIIAFAFAFIYTAVMDTYPVEAKTKDARYWYVKYKQEQRKSARYKQQRNSYRIAVRRMGPLKGSVIKWVRLKNCETKGYPGLRGWHYDGASGFDGGVQFSPPTWRAYGGRTFSKFAWQATPIQQVAIAEKVLARQGRGAWPGCTRKGAW